MRDFDVLIVGAGVAGCALARQLRGLKVCIFEKNKKPKLDSGIVSTDFDRFFSANERKKLIKREISSIDLNSPSNNIHIQTARPFAYLLDRERFAKKLRDDVEEKIIFEEPEEITIYKDFVEVLTNEARYTARLIVGADGVNSCVRETIEAPKPKMTTALRAKTENESFTVWMNKHFSPDGFAWAIPGECGVLSSIRPREYLEHFAKKCNLQIDNISGGQIPFGLTKCTAHRALLIGDAAGMAKPLTGGGIIFSLTAAQIAADVIKKNAKEDSFDAFWLGEYEKRFRRALGAEIRAQMAAKAIYRRMSNAQIDRLFTKLKPVLENIRALDYDRLSQLWFRLPKFTLLKAALGMI